MVDEPVVIPEKIYFKIGEVCELVGVQAHVLRYWETEFPMLSPQKNKSGQRSYRRRDVEIALRIKTLLYNEMFTIAGAKKKLQAEQKSGNRPLSPPARVQEPTERPTRRVDAPTLFENVFESEPSQGVSEPARAVNSTSHLAGSESEVIKTIASHLLEIRELLSSNGTSAAPPEK